MSGPIVYIIAGPNGAGKTTFAREYLPTKAGCLEFVNADALALGLSPLAPERAALEAGKLVLRRIRTLSQERKNFGFETTLAGRTYMHTMRELRERGYRLHIYFLWLCSADLAVRRVADRVRLGGHDVPEGDVRRRYSAGITNFFLLYRPLAHTVALLDNSETAPRLIAKGDENRMVVVAPDLARAVESASGIHFTGAQT